MKAFALWLCFSLMAMFFTTSMLLLSGVDRAMLHSPSGIISFISKNFQILANAFEWTNSTYIKGIFLQIYVFKLTLSNQFSNTFDHYTLKLYFLSQFFQVIF